MHSELSYSTDDKTVAKEDNVPMLCAALAKNQALPAKTKNWDFLSGDFARQQ